MKPIRGPCHRKCLKEDTEDYCLDCYNELNDGKKREFTRVEVGQAAGGSLLAVYQAEQEVTSAEQEVTSHHHTLTQARM